MVPRLEPCFTLRGYFSESITAGPPRVVTPITQRFFKGANLDAEVVPGGADCVRADPSSNVYHIDVRTAARTAEGHGFYIYYRGTLKGDEKATKVLTFAPDAQSTEFGDHEWFTTPVIETSHPDFKWVESSIFVGQGHLIVDSRGTAMEYQISKVVN